MITQVVPLVSMSNYTDPDFWVALGWKGAICTVVLAGLIFAVYKGKIKFVVVGRNEKGVREIFGVPVWPVFRAAHLHVDGIFGVRKAPTVPVPIELRQNILVRKTTKMEYVGTAFVQVGTDWKDLKQAIYSTLDTDKKDLENEMRDKQSRSILLGGSRTILTMDGEVESLTLEKLNGICASDLLSELGSKLVKLVNEEFTPVGMHILTPIGDTNTHVDVTTQAALAAQENGAIPRPTLVPPLADDAG